MRRRSASQYFCARGLRECGDRGRMVRVRVSCEDRGHSAADNLENALDVHGVVRTGIDHGAAVRADQVRVGPRAGHESGIACDQAAHARRDFVQLAG